MTAAGISKDEIGTPHYYELLQQEAGFWERSARGEMDISVATWRDVELVNVTSGDLIARALDLAAARGPRVLDLGCGDGTLSIPLARRGCVVDGVDISLGLLRQGHILVDQLRVTENWSGDVRFFVADLNRLALGPETYNVVLAAAALHHVIDHEHLMGMVYHALKPGGALICLDHMESCLVARILRYFWLFILPTEVPYWRKPLHAFNRLMARLYRRLPHRAVPAAFKLPDRSPFEDVSGSEAITVIRQQFPLETYCTCLIFADVVAGHLRFGSPERNVQVTRWLRRLDDWIVKHFGIRGDTYYLVARKPETNPG